MGYNPRYVHTNLIAKDWRNLARFYEEVFDCIPIPPERHISAEWLSEITGLEGAALEGIHLRLPGYGESGPTLEIFSYKKPGIHLKHMPNDPGFAHIAFGVDDVRKARLSVLAAGGHDVGQIVTVEIPKAGEITVVYMADPEGNLIELQCWSNQEIGINLA